MLFVDAEKASAFADIEMHGLAARLAAEAVEPRCGYQGIIDDSLTYLGSEAGASAIQPAENDARAIVIDTLAGFQAHDAGVGNSGAAAWRSADHLPKWPCLRFRYRAGRLSRPSAGGIGDVARRIGGLFGVPFERQGSSAGMAQVVAQAIRQEFRLNDVVFPLKRWILTA